MSHSFLRYTQCLIVGALPLSQAVSAAPAASTAAVAMAYPMTPDIWRGEKTTFAPDEAFPGGLMTVTEGYAETNAGTFAEGTVEFDIKALAYADTGILLHRRDADTAEFIYVRANPDCPAANDCVQYAPITNGRMQWNAYSRYQHSAPLVAAGWNHLRIVIADGRLRLFVNHALEPSLDVPRLQGLADRGGFAVKGPAIFANFVVRPDDKGSSAPPPVDVPQPGVVRHWLLGPVTPAPANGIPTLNDLPNTGWQPLEAEPDGLANLARAIPKNDGPRRQVAWLKVEIDAVADGARTVDLGFVPRAWLFLNGARVYGGENFYYPSAKRLAPAGRFAPDNARVELSLHKGKNTLVLATDDAWRRTDGTLWPDHYGWAAMARFEQPAGLTLR
ncbi:hypothetical protein EJC47_07700 [Sphingomonas sp. TF3]|nr:hypothetical protein EJC47_07700 [Sphingomonas sp. TF3]